MTTFLLSAVGGTGRKAGLVIVSSEAPVEYKIEGAYVALPADHLVAVELRGKGLERWLDETTTETENKMES